MSITEQEVKHVALLARLGLSDEELQLYREQLGSILEYISNLSNVDTTSVDEMSQVGSLVNVMREDKKAPSMSVEDALKNAPDHDGDYFKVGAIQE